MMENRVAKIIRVIGIVEGICGVLIGLSELFNNNMLSFAPIAIIIGSLVSAMLLVGFAEIISLVQKNVSGQEEILRCLRNESAGQEDQAETGEEQI